MNSKVVYLTPGGGRDKSEPERLGPHSQKKATQIAFDRQELGAILNIYGQMVSAGHWKDYALNFEADRAVFYLSPRQRTTALPNRENARPAEQAGSVLRHRIKRAYPKAGAGLKNRAAGFR